MRRSKPDYMLRTEYRIVCSGEGSVHAFHAFDKSSLEKAQKAVIKNNVDPVFLVNPVPGNQGCLPWYTESRTITPWRALLGNSTTVLQPELSLVPWRKGSA